MEKLRREKEVVGIYISGHPLDDFKREIKAFCKNTVSDFARLEEHVNRELTVAGVITDVQHRVSKNGKGWGLFTLEDYNESYELRIFGEEYLKFRHFLMINSFVHVRAYVREGWVNRDTGKKGDPRLQFNDFKQLQDVMDAFAKKRTDDEWEDLVVGLAVLCHDLGKPSTTHRAEDGRLRSPKHEPEGEEPTRAFLARLTNQTDLIEQVVPLVRRHLAPRVFHNDKAGDGAIRRLARQVKRIDRLVRVAEADLAGRPPRKDEFPEGPWLLEKAEELKVRDSEPKPIVLGRHLVERGMEPGPSFGPLLEECFEAQLDGAFADESGGLSYLDEILKGSSPN